MLFTAKTLSTLEYDKIIEMLVDCASTDGAKARAAALTPTDDFETVSARQRITSVCDNVRIEVDPKSVVQTSPLTFEDAEKMLRRR